MKWDESKHPRDKTGKFTDGKSDNLQSMTADELSKDIAFSFEKEKTIVVDTQRLIEDEMLPRSVGAKWLNVEIRMPDGSKAKFAEGAKLEKKEIIAGYGVRRKIDIIDILTTRYPETQSTPRHWAKLKGISEIVLNDGQVIHAEIHWYEHPQTGKKEFKYKDEADDES